MQLYKPQKIAITKVVRRKQGEHCPRPQNPLFFLDLSLQVLFMVPQITLKNLDYLQYFCNTFR